MKKIIVKRPNGTVRVIQDCECENSVVQQQFKSECNINKIMEKYHKGQGISHLNRKVGTYGDFTSIKDYSSALQCILDSQKAFMGLPSRVRSRFDNDPQRLMDFLSNKDNYNEAVELGIIDKPAVAPTQTTINDDAKMAKPQ